MESFKASMDFAWEIAQAVDSFKTSKEYYGAMVAFSQESFNVGHGIGFEDCRHLIAVQLP